jgi:hypothetical protein
LTAENVNGLNKVGRTTAAMKCGNDLCVGAEDFDHKPKIRRNAMPYTVVIENYHEFAQRHGNRPLNVAGRLLFYDGASCLDDGEGHQEPPTHPVENLRQRLAYWREAVRRSSADFESLRAECSRQAELAARYANLPGPPNAALSDLHKLRDAVTFCRDEVAKLEEEWAKKTADNPDRLRRQFREQYEREQQARAGALLSEIASLTI